MPHQRSIVITGASTGIGYTTAELFVKRGWQVFGSVRRTADGDRLQAALGQLFVPLPFDVSDSAAVDAAAKLVGDRLEGRNLGGLVNNAGIVIGGPLLYLPLDKMRRQLEINVLGPLKVAQAFAPLLGASRTRSEAPGLAHAPGRIVQISSTAGRFGVPFMGAYAASKHALEGMSESLRRELMLFGVDVIIVAPGAILTPIWNKTEDTDLDAYAETPYGPLLEPFQQELRRMGARGLPPERVADAIWTALTVPKPKTRYEVIPNRFREWVLPRLLPTRMVDRALAKSFGLISRAKPHTLPAK